MVGHPRSPLGPRRLAIHPGTGRPALTSAAFLSPPTGWASGILASRAAEIGRRVDRLGVVTQLEMELRRRDVAGAADARDHLATLDLIAPLDQQDIVVGVGGHPAIGVADQQ